MPGLNMNHIFVIVCAAIGVVTSYPAESGFEKRYVAFDELDRLYREVGGVSATMQDKIQCNQGKMVSVTQMKGQIYLGCSYFHPTEYFEIGVIQVYDAATLKLAAAPVEVELPQDEMIDKLIGSPTENVVYMITFSYGQPQKSIWKLSFPGNNELEANFFMMRPATLIGLKVTSDGKIVLNEADTISVYSADGKVISETVNPVQAQGQNTLEVLLLDNGNFLVSHVRDNNINECDLTEVSRDGKVIKSYTKTSSASAAKIGFAAGMELLDAGRLLLLSWYNEPDMSLEDSVLVIRTDLTDGQKVVSGTGHGVEEFGQFFSYSPSSSRLLIGFPYQSLVHAFKVSA